MNWVILVTALLLYSALPTTSDTDGAIRDFKRGDYRLALKDWTTLANNGDAGSQYFLGHMYAKGLGTPQDYTMAAFWFTKSASQGHSHGQFALGILYDRGWGVSEDLASALKWYGHAADQGMAMAHNNLGLLYEKGRGVPQDYVQAHMRFSLAILLSRIKTGTAIRNLDSLVKKMTQSQIEQAERLAQEWRNQYQH
jgi:TPR repeat protein